MYKYFFEESIDALVLLDIENNKFTLCNTKASELYGYTKEEFLKITPYDLSVEFKNRIQMESKQEEIINKGYDKFMTKHKSKYGHILDIYVKSKRILIDQKWFLLITLIDIEKEKLLKQYFHKKDAPLKYLISIGSTYHWDKFNMILLKHGEIVSLTQKEKNLINIFLKYKNSILSYENILQYFDGTKLSKNALLSIIKRIRKKTDNNFIATIYAKGYCIYC